MILKRIRVISLSLLLVLLSGFQTIRAESVEYEFSASSRSIMRAGPGQTLTALVQQLYPGHEAIWPRLEKEIKDRNPQAFNRYTGKIIPGERITLVTIKVLRKSHVLTQQVVGSVNSIKGIVTAIDTRGNQRKLSDKADLYEGDRLTTDKDATLIIKMIDDAEIHLKQDSSVRITEYVMKSGFETGSKSIIDLIKGGLRKLTGTIGANPLSVYKFHTGVMTIGVRGTDYVVKLCDENNCLKSSGRNDGGTRLHVVVLDGLISLMDEEGTVGELKMGQYAVATAETKVIVTDANPFEGLLDEDEQKIYTQVQSTVEKENEESKSFWPWFLGGALLGI